MCRLQFINRFPCFFGIASVFLKQLKIILLLGYFAKSCKFISIFFVLRNQFCILTFVAFSEHSVFIFDRCKYFLVLSTVLLAVVFLFVTIFLKEHVYLLLFEKSRSIESFPD